MNIGRILLMLIGASLLGAGNSAYAGPDAEQRPAANPVWGDPEEDGEPHEGWTWFGMGYENRNRAWGQIADPLDDSVGNSTKRERKEQKK